MPRVSGDSDKAKFCVTVWKEETSYFDNREHAEQEFVRRRGAREHGVGEIYRWSPDDDDWIEIEAFNHFK